MGSKKFVVNGLPTHKKQKLKYPRSVFFIVSNEFCERFSYYGMRTILSLYLVYILAFSEPEAKIIYHLFTMFVYFFPVFGAIIADSWLGKFRTIFYVSCIYACGNVVLALAATGPLNLPQREISILGLMLIAVGTGGIKPCVSAFGGDQFKLPQQASQLAKFFSLFYFAINAGSLISTLLTPILREEVHCFGMESCFPLAFGIPGILMVVSLVIFVAGKPLYNIKNPEGNVMVEVSKCIGHALGRKMKNGKALGPREHWLDHADDTYDKGLIEDIKATLKVLWLYLPIPVFWALFDQQGTGWTFQATRMSGDIGITTILPDQMQVVNPLLILAFIPLFDTCIYPLLAKCHLLKKPLQRLTVGGLLAAVAFGISGVLELQLEKTYPKLPEAGLAQLRVFNSAPCAFTINNNGEDFELPTMDMALLDNIKVTGENVPFQYTLTPKDGCPSHLKPTPIKYVISEKGLLGQLIKLNSAGDIEAISYKDDIEKSSNGYPIVRTLVNTNDDQVYDYTYISGTSWETRISSNTSAIGLETVTPDTYNIRVNDTGAGQVDLKLGGVYTVLIDYHHSNTPTFDINLMVISEPNSIHILWLIPQYVVITMAEIMFSVTGLEFSYSQAPVSMKSVMQAGWLLTTAFGNLLVVIIEEAKVFDSQALQYFLYAGLMVIDMIIFALMAMRYKYVEKDEDSSVEETHIEHADDVVDVKDGYAQNTHPHEHHTPRPSSRSLKGIENMSYKHDDAI